MFKGDKGDKGDKGEKGNTGESGIAALTNGFFTLSVDDNGDLLCHYTDTSTPPTFNLDDSGDLYIVVPD